MLRTRRSRSATSSSAIKSGNAGAQFRFHAEASVVPLDVVIHCTDGDCSSPQPKPITGPAGANLFVLPRYHAGTRFFNKIMLLAATKRQCDSRPAPRVLVCCAAPVLNDGG